MLKNSKAFKFLIGTFAVAAIAFAMSASAAWDFGPSTLKVGSKGEYVKTLQTLVGASPVDGSFGPMTKAKVMAWQANNGLTADGVFGPMSKAKANEVAMGGSYPAGCSSNMGFSTTTGQSCAGTVSTVPGCTAGALFSSTTGASCSGTTTTGALAGTAGVISDINTLSQYNAEEVGSGQNDVKVLGFEVEASKDGDIALNSVKVRFDSTGNNALDSDRLADYVSNVSVWQGSTKVGSAVVADFTKESTGNYTKVISLSNAVVRADKIEKFYVTVDSLSNLDSGDIDSDSWTISLGNVRYTDGSGVVTTETAALPTDIDWAVAGDGIAIAFVSFSTSADTELKLSIDSASPVSGIVTVSSTAQKDNVTLLKGKFKLDGSSAVLIDELPVLFTATGATNVDYITNSVTLTIGSQSWTKSMGALVGATETITFNNLDYTLPVGSGYVYFTVSADVNETDANFEVGDSLSAAITATERAAIVVENAQGDQLADGTEMTGTASGEAQYFHTKYAQLTLVSKTFVPGTDATTDHIGTATFVVKAKAVGGTIYMNGDDEVTGANEAFQLSTIGGGAGTSTLSAASYTVSGATTNGNSVTNSGADNEYYTIAEDQEITFTITATITQTVATTTVGVEVDSILFGVDATSDTTRSALPLNWSSVTDQFETAQATLFV